MSTLTLPEGIVCLENALGAANGHINDHVVNQGEDLLVKVRGRRAEGTEHTVVAFAGATGSGKSSMLNAVLGESVAPVAARRPTTSQPLAVTGAPVSALTRWLGIEEVATSASLPATPDSQLVLVDLPDIDSTEYAHRAVAQKILARADLIVWVADPQKYADSVWHDDYLAAFSHHSAVSLVAFNQVDRLEAHELPAVLSHLRELFALEGFEANIIPTSATTGAGIRELQEAIGKAHDSKQVAMRRLAADLQSQGEALITAVESEDGVVRVPDQPAPFSQVSDVLLEASGSNRLADAAATSYRQRGKRRVGWLGTSWLTRGADPLKDNDSVSERLVPEERQLAIARASVHRYASRSAENLPRRWRYDVVGASEERTDSIACETSSLASKADLGRKDPLWWGFAAAFQWLAGLVAVAGLAWMVVLWLTAAFHIQFPEPPAFGPIAVPTMLLIGGLLAGILGAIVGRWVLARGASRTRSRVHGAIGQQVTEAAESAVAVPLREELAQYGRFVEDVQNLRRL
ncbi:MAG: GTPase [Ancrocorticia populi]|uniref:GTPase n=1 Tax=Ancrocorticia populi TaxID=2175228 RepID=UPI003F91CCD5